MELQIYPHESLKTAGIINFGAWGVFLGGQAWAWLPASALHGHCSLPHVSVAAGPDKNFGMWIRELKFLLFLKAEPLSHPQQVSPGHDTAY